MSVLETTKGDGYVVVTLNDPDRRNLLSPEMIDGLYGAVEAAEADPEVNAIVVTGNGRAFCAGADVSKLGDQDQAGLLHIYGAFMRLARSSVLTIAAVNGAAVGAGVNLALAADIRLAGASSRFDTRFLSIGLHPGGGHTWMLERAVGPQAAAAMDLFGDRIGGERAAEIGLAWRCVGDDELLDGAVELAARAAAVPRELSRKIKATLRETPRMTGYDDAVATELDRQRWSFEQGFMTQS